MGKYYSLLSSVYYDYVSFLVQLCFMKLMINLLMLRCFCLLVGFPNIYCSVFSHPVSAQFSIRSDHSGQLSGCSFCCLTWKLPSWCPLVLLQFGLVALLASHPAVILELSFVVVLEIPSRLFCVGSLFFWTPCLLSWMLPYFGRVHPLVATWERLKR